MIEIKIDMGGTLKQFKFKGEDPSSYKKADTYKGFVIGVNCYGDCAVFTAEEWKYGDGCRYPEWDGDSYFGCMEFIKGLGR